MSVEIVDILFAALTLSIGAAAGWWLCSRGGRPPIAASETEEVRRAHEVLACLQRLTSHVAKELGQHSSKVEEINEELVAGGREPTKIIHVVAKLVDANKLMQGRLDLAEDRLREQSQLVESHAIEARTDALTLLGNRRALDAEIAQHFAEFSGGGQPFVVAMLDLDKFKRFNDTHGHQAGDELLRCVGRVLRRTVRDEDVATRYGGEEFAVILPKSGPEESFQILTRMRTAIEKASVDYDGTTLKITASLGATQSLRGDRDFTAIIRRADEALYASKNAGRNCSHWNDGQTIAEIPLPEKKPVEPKDVEPKRVEPAAPRPLAEVKVAEPPPPQTARPMELPVDEPVPELPTDMNRTSFCQHVRGRIAEWKRGGPSLSVVLVQIDQFETLAGCGGQQTRERVMEGLIRLVLATVRETDLVAHYRPGSLAFSLPAARLPDAIRVAERLRRTVLESVIPVDGSEVHFTVSIGVIEVTAADNLVTLFRRAEAAVDAGRQRGGNCTYLHDGKRCAPITAMLEVVNYFG